MQKCSALLALASISLTLNPCLSEAQSLAPAATTTPIKHLVVIYDENISFDHYFGTYPNATNPPGEPAFTASPNTPAVNNLTRTLLNANPDSAAPFRLDRSEAVTCDNDNHYTDEQKAYDGGLIDQVSELLSGTGAGCTPNLAMGYYDGNTVTALWNYAQHFAMSDNFFGTNFGTTVMGHLNLISGQTHGATPATVSGKVANGSVIANIDGANDDCSTGTTIQMAGKNVGDLLNAKSITWGWFYGDFTPTASTGGVAQCTSQYDDHYDPFQYYASTANPTHARPSSVKTIGFSGDPANHDYDIDDFFAAVSAGNFPTVSFLKAISIEDAHPGNSDPLDEQQFVVRVANFLQAQPEWANTALIVLYDDSDGWYDHQLGQIVNGSKTSADALTGPGSCGNGLNALPGLNPATTHAQGRCGYGPRQPLLVISPWAQHNYVDHSVTDQTSVLRFIEDNWLGGERVGQGSFDGIANSITSLFDFKQTISNDLYILNEQTGEPVKTE